jgi:hypothetical protein
MNSLIVTYHSHKKPLTKSQFIVCIASKKLQHLQLWWAYLHFFIRSLCKIIVDHYDCGILTVFYPYSLTLGKLLRRVVIQRVLKVKYT